MRWPSRSAVLAAGLLAVAGSARAQQLDSLVVLARARHIRLTAGATDGGNDGSTFTRFGVPDVAFGWPMRYAHSPAEVIDLTDLVALADIVQAIAEKW